MAKPGDHRASVGREAEFRVVAEFLSDIPSGPTVLLLEGEAGIGKTTIWKETVAAAQKAGIRVITSRPVRQEANLPFTALGDLLDRVLDEALPRLPGPQQRALEVALVRAEAQGTPADPRAVSLAALGVVRAVAADSPVLMAIDDIHLLDAPSARVIDFILRRLDAEPVGILAALRSGEAMHDPLQLPKIAPSGRYRELRVGPLPLEAVDVLLRRRLQAPFVRPAVLQLHRISNGNPFFALELGRAWLRQGVQVVPQGSLPLPSSLKALIGERLAALPSETNRTLLVVSALYHPTIDLVSSALGSIERTVTSLTTVMEMGVIEAEGNHLRFTHPLFSSVVYTESPIDVRRKLHRKLADIVPDPEQRARHLALAAESADGEVAAALDDAARRAHSRGAPEMAAELVELAIRLTPPGDGRATARRRADAAQHYFESGDTPRARALLEEVVANSPPGPAKAEALRRLGNIRWYDGTGPALQLLSSALREAGDDDATVAAISRDLTWLHLLAGDAEVGAQHADTAVRLAEELGNRALLGEALTALAFSDAMVGGGKSLDIIRRAVELEQWTEGVRIFRHPTMMFGVLLKWSDDFDGARTRFEAMRRRAVETGDETALPFLYYHLSEMETWAGNLRQAEADARQSCRYAIETGQEAALAASLYGRALVEAHCGRVEEARASAAEGAEIAARTGSNIRLMQNLLVPAFLALSLGDAQEALAYLEQIDKLAERAGPRDTSVIRYAPLLVEALVMVDDLDRASACQAEHEERAVRLQRRWALGAALRGRALILGARGDLRGAAEAASRSVERLRTLGQPFELARALLVLGGIQRRSKQGRLARAALDEARLIFERVGTPLWVDRAGAEIVRLSGRAEQLHGLTATEWRVAALAAAGKTNREIASEMFIALKTVEVNLTRIYTKLGVRSRTELAVWMSAHKDRSRAE